VEDLDRSMAAYWNLLGIGPWDVLRLNQETVRDFTLNGRLVTEPFEFMVAVTPLKNTQFELIQPVTGPTPYADFLGTHGEGLHHLKEEIPEDQIQSVVREYAQSGIPVLSSGRFDDDIFYYFDTRSTLGFIYEVGNCGQVREPERRFPDSI